MNEVIRYDREKQVYRVMHRDGTTLRAFRRLSEAEAFVVAQTEKTA